MKALNDFLMSQRLVTLKDINMWVCNAPLACLATYVGCFLSW